ncbi:PEA2 [Candida margitis]|uniref:PEA2 n=1 Tax=Candida margitis TaxID=1775924 RepID=UPI002225F993|nr:PEA2 [Candida margitis]KAI5953934.1 PEA2 [Candida margitis]
MIDTQAFNQESPFKQTHNDSASHYNLTNTTQDLVKFQLQEQYRSSLNVAADANPNGPSPSLFHDSFRSQDSFNNHLQASAALYPSLINIPSLSSTPTSTDDDEAENYSLDMFLQSNKPNYMNLKILIENAAFDSDQLGNESVLPLHEIEKLKQKVEEKQELQQYLLSKIAVSQQFINEVVYKDNVDSETLIRVIKTVSSLQSQLISNNKELDDARQKVNNHNLSCMLLGYIEDVKRSRLDEEDQSTETLSEDQVGKLPSSTTSSPTKQSHSSPKLFESLCAHIASIAAQRNVTLAPPPTDDDDVAVKLSWMQHSIDAVLLKPATSQLTEDTTVIANNSMTEKSFTSSPSTDSSKTLAEYRTALTDLKFSYQYLAKEYELSRISSSKLIQDYRKRIEKLEKNKGIFDSDSCRSSVSGSISPIHATSLESKNKEITKLRKELNLLKVDNIGVSKRSSAATSLKHSSADFSSPQVGKNSGTSDEDDTTSQISSVASRGGATSASGVSNGILRSEFKKIVSEMQDFYEQELAEERMVRKRLEEDFDRLSSQHAKK